MIAMNLLDDPKRRSRYGFLYRGVKYRFYWFRCLAFVTNFALAVQAAVAPSAAIKTFLALLFFLINIVGVGMVLPFRSMFNNGLTFIIGWANIIPVYHIIVIVIVIIHTAACVISIELSYHEIGIGIGIFSIIGW